MAEPLTKRRLEIIKLSAEGMSSEEIAKELNISFETVKSHKKTILLKLNAKNIVNAVVISMRKGYIE